MPKQTTHPSPEELGAYSLGQLPPEEAAVIESHISECAPCCETIVGLSSDDTFVGLLKEARQLPADQAVALDTTPAQPSSSLPHVPAPLAEHSRYEIVGLIGKGGMGDVYKARHRMMKRTVALKIIKPELVRKPEAVDRFHREVTTAAQLSHPNIVTAYDAEQAGDVHFLVMEYVDGIDLSHTVKDRGALPVAEACEYVRQAATGLKYAHERSMVHRDIKPHNLMVMVDGTVKILDFGLASLAPEALPDSDTVEARGDLTAAGAIMGTPDFISPEQADDARQADIRSDIYSLGATLYFLLSGRTLFVDGSVMHKLKSHAQVEPEPLESLRNDIPAELAAVVSKMMAKDPHERFQTPAEVAEALSPFAVASLEAAAGKGDTSGQIEAKLDKESIRPRLLSRVYSKAVAAGIMTPKEAETQAQRLADLLWFLPLVVIILIGFWSHRRFGSEGIVGILLGLYGLTYLAIVVPRLATETASPMRRIISRHRKAVAILFLACIVAGALEMTARFNFSGPAASKAKAAYEDLRSYLDSGSNRFSSQNSVNVLLGNRDGGGYLTKLGNDFDTFAYAEGDFPHGLEALVIYLMDDRFKPTETVPEIKLTTYRQGYSGGLTTGVPDQIRLNHLRIRKKLEERTVVIGFSASDKEKDKADVEKIFNLRPGASYEAEINLVDWIDDKVDWIDVWKRGKLVAVVAEALHEMELKAALDANGDGGSPPAEPPPDDAQTPAEPDALAKRKTTAFLIEAAKSGDLEAVKAALRAGVDPNGPPDQLTALHWAVAQRISEGKTIEPSREIAKKLIEAGANVNAKDYLGQTPLEWAAKYASPDVVQVLIKAGSDVNAESRYGTVLMAGRRVEIAKLLIEAGADVNAGRTMKPLANAAVYGNVELIRLLVENGANVNDPKNPPIHGAGKPEVARALLEAGADANEPNAKGETALHLPYPHFVPTAATVERLIDAGADVNAKSKSGSTPLHAAVQQGKPEIAKLLIASGADVDAKDQQGNTPLSLARGALSWARGNEAVVNKPYEAAVQLLVDAGAKDDGRTPLQQAVEAGKLGEVKKMIASKVDVNETGRQRITAVHIASEKGHTEILAALIEAGVKVDQPDAQGMRPLHFAANADIARALIAKGAKVNSRTPSPLYMATAAGRADVVRELVRSKANVKDSDCAGMLNWATFFGRIEVVKVLLEERDAKALLSARDVYSPLHIATSGSFGDMNSPDDVTQKQRLDIAKLLVEKGADVSARWGANVDPQSGAAPMIDTTPLMFGSSKGEAEMVKFLLDQGADTQAANASGQTALHFAAQRGHRPVVELLLTAKADVNALTGGAKTPLDLAQDAAVKVLLIQNGGNTASEVLKDSQLPKKPE